MAFDWKADFANRVAKNPSYRKMAEYATGSSDHPRNDDYFYAFKDAYEKTPGSDSYMSRRPIKNELTDSYYRLADDFRQRKGYGQRQWDDYGISEFEDEYGYEDDFVNKGLDAWSRFMAENYGGESEDHQNFGSVIYTNPERFKDDAALRAALNEWGGNANGEYPYDDEFYGGIYNFWKNKLFGGK